MKYLKLFEAFESNIFSKTLKYLSKEGKDRFFQLMKAYCDKYDYPFSKLNDDSFEYLPFSAALKKYISSADIVEDCKATSKEVFGDKGVADDVCTKGKLKRIWGKGVRNAECPKCLGTGKIKVGVKKDAPEGYELTKIWIDELGNIIEITCTDGTGDAVRIKEAKPGVFPTKYEVDKEITSVAQFSRSIRHLQPVLISVDDVSDVPGIFYIDDDEYFVITNNGYLDGEEPDSRDWKKYGEYSWQVDDGDFYVIKTVKSKDVDIVSDEVDHYSYNKRTVKAKSGWYVKKDDAITPVKLRPAKFAIIFDSGKLKSTSFTKKTEIVTKRAEQKVGAAAFDKPEDIKKQNLDRWVVQLASKNVTGKLTDLSSLDNYIFRILGNGNILFKLLKSGYSDLENVIDNFFTMLEGVGPDLEVDSHNESLLFEANLDELLMYEREFMRALRHLDETRVGRDLAMSMQEYYEETFHYILDEGDYSKTKAKIMAIRYTLEEFEYQLNKLGFKPYSKSSTEKPKEVKTTPTKSKIVDKVSPVKNLLYKIFTKSLKENEELGNEIKVFIESKSVAENDKLVLRKTIEISNFIYTKLKSFGKIQNLDDAELILQKIKSIKSTFDSKRWEFNKMGYTNIKSFSKKIDDAQKDKIIQSLDQLKNIINKI